VKYLGEVDHHLVKFSEVTTSERCIIKQNKYKIHLQGKGKPQGMENICDIFEDYSPDKKGHPDPITHK